MGNCVILTLYGSFVLWLSKFDCFPNVTYILTIYSLRYFLQVFHLLASQHCWAIWPESIPRWLPMSSPHWPQFLGSSSTKEPKCRYGWLWAPSQIQSIQWILDFLSSNYTKIRLPVITWSIFSNLLPYLNHLGDAIWWPRSRSTLDHVMAWCRLYLNQCWLTKAIVWYLPESNFTGITHELDL